jgi:phosphoribosylglycinamide formyltransferase-1
MSIEVQFLTLPNQYMNNIAIFISGTGSNACRMINEYHNHNQINVSCLLSTKPNQDVESLCKELNVSFKETGWSPIEQDEILANLREEAVEWIILAGFLKKIPSKIVTMFSNRIINMHPSLLPKFGGKGMYGMNVHKAVISAGEKKSGITIHCVNGQYDEGRIIKQFSVDIESSDDENSLFEKIRRLEVIHFVKVVEQEILKSD